MTINVASLRTLGILGGCLAGAGLLAAGGVYWYNAYQARAGAAYAEAMTRAQESREPQASADLRAAAVRGLETTLETYPSSAGAAPAAYELANLRYAAREYPAARGAFEVALAKGARGTLRTLSRAGVAYSWEAERNLPKAVAAFQAALSGLGPTDFLYEELMMDLARVQELAGSRDAAIATYRRILQELPKARRGDDIRARLASLGTPAKP